MAISSPDRASLTRYAWLSIATAILTMGLKVIAYLLTGSVGLLSDAAESLVNLAGAVMALAMLIIAARPADEDHAYGHSKAEYFSSGVEGTLILVAALTIAVTAIQRILQPKELEQVGVGLAVSVAASLLNLAVALVLRRAGRKNDSVTLAANSQHLMTDVWTSGGVIVAIALVGITGFGLLDPIVALVVAANITWTGVSILRGSALGLMDTSLPAPDRDQIRSIIEAHCANGIQYHAFRTRQAGARRFVSFHILVPGAWTVHQGHEFLEQIERDIRDNIPNVTILTHLESLEDSSSWDDTTLDRSL